MSTRRESDSNLGLWAGIAAAVGVGYAAYSAFSKDSSSDQKSSASHSVVHQGEERKQQKHSRLVLAVDATPKYGGAVLRSSHNRTICYYSVDWSTHFKFPQESQFQAPEIFELTNAILAMEFFESEIKEYCQFYKDFIVKIDNSVMNTSKLYPRDALRAKAKSLIEEIDGTWDFVQKPNDTDMALADKLSRRQYGRVNEILVQNYSDYERLDYSATVSSDLDNIQQYVPAQYRR